MKKLIALIGVAVLALATVSQSNAQVPTMSSSTVSVPTLIPAGVTTNLASPAYIDCSRSQYFGLQADVSWSTDGEGTGANTNLIYTLGPSQNGTTYSTNQTLTWAAANRKAAGGNNVTVSNSIPCGTIQGYYVFRIQNTSAGGVATNTLTANQKISSP